MLKLRVATAVVLLLILWFAIWAGPLAFAGVMAICFGLVLYEWLRIGNLGPVPAALIAAIEMISQFSLYWAQALPKMDWFLFIVNGGVMVAWGVIFFAEYAGDQNVLLYSLGYNAAYLAPEMVIAMLISLIPGMARLVETIRGKKA